ncbi:MAG: RNA polymerase sigma factor [Flavobacteriales bacterium]
MQDHEEEEKYIYISQRDPRAFEWLYNRHHDRIFRYVYSKVRDTEQTADLTSEVFLKALMNIRNYEPKGIPFSAWLFRIAVNEVNMYFRRSGKVKHISVHEDLREEWNAQWDDPVWRRRLAEALGRLSPEDLQLIEWRFFDGIRFKEIAEMESSTEAAVKMKVYRILEVLKKQLETRDEYTNR